MTVMNVVGIHQPNYLPWLGYFSKIKKSDIFIFLDDCEFSKNGYFNRVQIKGPNGSFWLTVPILTKKKSTLTIGEIKQVSDQWKKKHLKAIKNAFVKAPYKSCCMDLIERSFLVNLENLSEFNINFIQNVSEFLNLKTKFVRSRDANLSSTSNHRLIELVKLHKGQIYLHGKGGESYQENQLFADEKISLKAVAFNEREREQNWGGFVGGLSILDLLFNYGPNDSLEFL